MSVAVWAVRWTRPLLEEEAAALASLLPPARRERLGRQPRAKREETLCGYALLLLALRRREGWTVFPKIAIQDRGKPCFPEYPGVEFSVSHTAGAALAAVSDRPVGVDIERIRPVRPEAMRRIAGTEDPDVFFRKWVRREARSKCAGQGVGAMLRSEPPLETGEYYRELCIWSNYAAGAAYYEPGEPELFQLDLAELTGGLF